MHISYPSPADRENAKRLGVAPGGDVEIFGFGWIGSLHRKMDWTDGCVTVTNEEIDEIYPLVEIGTEVEIRP